MFGKPSLSNEYARIIRQLEEGERHVPQHNRPKSIHDSGFESFVTPAHEVLFEDFNWFGALMNRQTADPWAVEETPDTLLKDLDDPDLGRTYNVYYNAVMMGRLQIGIGDLHSLLHPQEFIHKRSARAFLQLNWLRFVPYDDAHQFVSALGLLLGRFEEHEAAYARAAAAATAALMGYLWESVRVEDAVMDFEYRTEGPYDLLLQTTDHWKANGIDPFESWNGDR
jgi:hypothetical protein